MRRIKIRRPSGVDILVFQPCNVIRFTSLARGKLLRMFVRIGIKFQAPPATIAGLDGGNGSMLDVKWGSFGHSIYLMWPKTLIMLLKIISTTHKSGTEKYFLLPWGYEIMMADTFDTWQMTYCSGWELHLWYFYRMNILGRPERIFYCVQFLENSNNISPYCHCDYCHHFHCVRLSTRIKAIKMK